ncbi:MAG: ATP-binding protein, partial [Planctomycetales bacterium]
MVDLDMNLTDINAGMLQAFDISEKESIIGRKCYEVFKGLTEPCPYCAVIEAWRTKAPVRRTSAPDDLALTSGIIFEIFAYPITDDEGNVTGAVEFARDITERIQAKEELQKAHDELEERVKRRTNELQLANYDLQEEITNRKRSEERELKLAADMTHMDRVKTMGEMASGIAHELNQPLAVIVTRAETVAHGLRIGKEPSKEKLLEHLKWIADQGHRAGEIIRHMRHFVRHVEPNRTTCKLNAIISEVVPLLENDLRLGQIALTIDAAPSLPMVLADKIQLQQVLLNLMRNGMEAMERTEPDQREMSVRATPRDGLLEVAVCDAGCGISEDQIDRLFGTFYSTKVSGMGMGLAISRTIIETHGGKLWGKSNTNRGATFTFTLPTA